MEKLPKEQKIYSLTDISIDSIVARHIELLEKQNEPQQIITNFDEITCDSTFVAKTEIIEGANKTFPRKQILYKKYTFLVHKLIQRCKANKEGNFTHFNSVILQTTLGAAYKEMLETLASMDIVKISNKYIPTIQARLIELNSKLSISSETRLSSCIEEYSLKMEQALKKHEQKQVEEIKSEMGDELYENYTKSLNQLKLIYKSEAEDYGNRHKFITSKSKDYYDYILREYEEKNFRILAIDKNLRIYSILTQSPRILKNFVNIKFTSDIHNSHPLLFNKLIIDNYNIDNNILLILYNNLNIEYTPYSVGKQLRNMLINNGIQKVKIANIPNDIWEYIFKTSKGIFWDDFAESQEFKRLRRSDIKVTLFREVFYSKTLTARGKEYAKAFSKKYPSVYKLVKKWKREDRTALANKMMRIESELFRNILEKLYNKRFKVATIHDAIVVLDVKSNALCTPKLVQSIIRQEYRKAFLFPNIDAESYSLANVESTLQQEEQDLKTIAPLIENLELAAKNENHPKSQEAKDMLEELEKGIAEIYINHTTNEAIWHPMQ